MPSNNPDTVIRSGTLPNGVRQRTRSQGGSQYWADSYYAQVLAPTTRYRYVNTGPSTITWEIGPKWDGYHDHLQWKRCFHTRESHISGGLTSVEFEQAWGRGFAVWQTRFPYRMSTVMPKPDSLEPAEAMLDEARANLEDKFDLNTKDRVMGYSYVLDLLPFLGAFTRASSVLNNIGRWAAKRYRSYRSRPFWSVVQDAINADLINRFVIQTTIQDTKNILDSYDRCVRTFQTMHKRNMELTTLTGRASTSSVTSQYSTYLEDPFNPGDASITGIACKNMTTARAMVRAVVELRYNTQRADPLAWIAAQLGISTPLESVWDKIPFSFVIDYFFKVGDFISEVSDQYTSQEGLVGKLAAVRMCWATLECANERILDASGASITFNRYRYDRVNSFVKGQAKLTSSVFSRFPYEMMARNGFWDKGGLWDPHLSSVRKRTLIELGVKLKLR